MKRLPLLVLLLVVLASLCACKSSKQKAHELAEENVYKPVEYKNAAVPGPEIVVLPGEMKSANVTFVQKVTENNIRDYAELELSKANFKVLERADSQEFFNEFALAANLGDTEALAIFKKGRFKATNWLLAFDVLKAEPVADVKQNVDGTTAGLLVGLALTLAGSSDAGRIAGTTIASIKGSDSSVIWNVGLRYKILDANTGMQVATGYFEDKLEIKASMQSFLGATQAQSSAVTLDTLVQRLVQKAVQEIDGSHKTGAPAGGGDAAQLAENAAEEAADAKPAGKKDKKAAASKSNAAKEKKIIEEYQAKAAEHKKQKDADAAMTTLKGYFAAFSQIDRTGLLACTCPSVQQEMEKGMEPMYQVAAKNPDWRKVLTVDVSKVTYEIVEQQEDTCKIKVGGEISLVVDKKDPKTTPQNEEYTLTRENGRWKVCTVHFS
jgi:predicted lipid-binding transport protein (Tim44 family)